MKVEALFADIHAVSNQFWSHLSRLDKLEEEATVPTPPTPVDLTEELGTMETKTAA